jgi:hypothetical protein
MAAMASSTMLTGFAVFTTLPSFTLEVVLPRRAD